MRALLLLLVACGPTTPEGDADAGWDTLRYGNYVGAGVPKDVWFDLIPPTTSNLLDREGDAAGVPSSFNLFTARNGVDVVGGITCVGCHSAPLRGETIIGLGNHQSDYTELDLSTFELAGLAVENRYGDDSPEYDAFFPLLRGAEAISEHIVAPFIGVNTAFSMERAAVANRDPQTGAWQDELAFEIPATILASDVPPWWHLKKKTRLYYTGAGRGNHARLVSQVSVVAIDDAEHYLAIEEGMADLLAFAASIEPPPFPGDIDPGLTVQGEALFTEHCEECHGTYGDDWTYPERIEPLEEIGTDPTYALGFLEGGFTPWLQESFLAQGKGRAIFEPERGYVAPPLDGVWATAPYLHNGSVPDIETLLSSSDRPAAWRRTFNSNDYDFISMGWGWTPDEAGTGDVQVYDTTITGFGNGGHTYGDVLSGDERAAVIEFLKTL
ncbi:MAG: hypothetical protein ACJAZO_003481 [Myxococcota bacterium]|jgi:hypothetical protein